MRSALSKEEIDIIFWKDKTGLTKLQFTQFKTSFINSAYKLDITFNLGIFFVLS